MPRRPMRRPCAPVAQWSQGSRAGRGAYRLRARILPRDGSTLLALQAELLADAYNVLEFEPQQVERFSNGVIEDSLYARLEQALDSAPAQD